MRMVSIFLCLMALLALSVSLTGCGDKAAESKKEKAASAAPSHDSHDGHDHGEDDAAHQHSVEGPHGGQLIELGDKAFQAEMVQDEKTNTITIHLLDATGKKAVATAQAEITLQLLRDGKFIKYVLKAVPGKDTASEFKIVDKSLSESLCHDEKIQGRLQVTIDGKAYTGNIKLSGHDHDDDHDKDHDKDHDHGDGDHDHGDDDHKH